MEIGDKAVQNLKMISGININAGPSRALLQRSILRRPALHRTAGGGPNADDPAAVFPGFVDDIRSLSRDHTVLRVHLMLQRILLLHRAKSPKAHMEGHIADLYAQILHLAKKLFCEMETGGGGGGGTDLP